MTSDDTKFRLPPISPAAPGPLYRQIVEGFRREISEGRLAPGEALPSFRALAEDLLVSLITVRRAYDELEREGLIYRKQGLGAFVSEDAAALGRAAKAAHAEELMGRAIREAVEAGMSPTAIGKLARELIRKQEGEETS